MRLRPVLAILLLLPLGPVGQVDAAPRDDEPLLAQRCDSGPAAAVSASGPLLPVALRPTFPNEAVDHTVTYASSRGWGPTGGDRVILSRHGPLVRREVRYIGSKREFDPDREVSFSNLATSATIEIGEAQQGDLTGVALWRGAGSAASATRTGETELIAGEQCSVWQGQFAKSSVQYSACTTDDGVVLRDTIHYSRGNIMEEQIAIEVQRHPIDPAHVLPPRKALDWAHWSAGHDRAAASDRPANYEVVLASRVSERGEPGGAVTYRAAAGWTLTEDCAPAHGRSTQIVGSATSLGYFARPEGEMHLSLSRPPNSDRSPFSMQRLSLPSAKVLGESCSWTDAAAGVSDYGRSECRTSDNLPLIITETSRGSHRSREAVSLSRGRTSVASVQPPSWLLDWALWGWPELSRPSR